MLLWPSVLHPCVSNDNVDDNIDNFVPFSIAVDTMMSPTGCMCSVVPQDVTADHLQIF